MRRGTGLRALSRSSKPSSAIISLDHRSNWSTSGVSTVARLPAIIVPAYWAR